MAKKAVKRKESIPIETKTIVLFYLFLALLCFVEWALFSGYDAFSNPSSQIARISKIIFTEIYYVYGISSYGFLSSILVPVGIVSLISAYSLWAQKRWGLWLILLSSGFGLLLGIFNLFAGLFNYALVAIMTNGVVFYYMVIATRPTKSRPGQTIQS